MKKPQEEPAVLDLQVKFKDVLQHLANVLDAEDLEIEYTSVDLREVPSMRVVYYISYSRVLQSKFKDFYSLSGMLRIFDSLKLPARKANMQLCKEHPKFKFTIECLLPDMDKFLERLLKASKDKATNEFHDEVDKIISQ